MWILQGYVKNKEEIKGFNRRDYNRECVEGGAGSVPAFLTYSQSCHQLTRRKRCRLHNIALQDVP